MSADFTEKIKVSNASICESCGREFFCGVETGNCWCFDVNLPAQTLAEIGERYKKCLCPDCLNDEKHKSYFAQKTV